MDAQATIDKVKYFKLEILRSETVSSDVAHVEFRVWFKTVGQLGNKRISAIPMQTMTETSKFLLEDGKWLYSSSEKTDHTSHPYSA